MHHDAGVLVVDERGAVQYSSGIASGPAVVDALVALWQARADKPLPAMLVLDLNPPIVVVCNATAESGCFLVQAYETGDPLVEFVGSVDFAGDIMRHFITNPYEAMTVVDATGTIRYISPVHERFFKLPHGAGVGRKAREVIENTRLDVVLRTKRAEIGQAQEMHGTTRIVSRSPIQDHAGRTVGAIGQVMFKSAGALQEMSAELGRLRQELGFYKRELSGLHRQTKTLDSIVGDSDAILKLKSQIMKVAPLDVPVLLLGASGVGKDLVAHALQQLSPRANEPMVVINAAALPTTLVESELFGYEGGAFTGAERRGRMGKFEQANRGTLFLDEIGDMPLEIQVKLLRTLQDGTFQRLGGDAVKQSDFRLISASNRDFKAMLADGTFRLDLFYRMSAVSIRVPSLSERLEDIGLLVDAALHAFADRHGAPLQHVAPDVIPYLQSLPWPGNVRQLQHAVDRAAIFSEGEYITIDDFEPSSSVNDGLHLGASTLQRLSVRESSSDMRSAKSQVASELIVETMSRLGGNKKKVAEHLGISRSYLYKKLAGLEGS